MSQQGNIWLACIVLCFDYLFLAITACDLCTAAVQQKLVSTPQTQAYFTHTAVVFVTVSSLSNTIIWWLDALCISVLRAQVFMLGENENTPKGLSRQKLPSSNKFPSLTHLLFKWVKHPDTAAVTTAAAQVTVPLSSRCFGNGIEVSSLSSLPSIHPSVSPRL